MTEQTETTARRKDAHLDLCAAGEVEPGGSSTLLHCVHLVHCALPELACDELALGAELCGKKLRAPLVITGMTGGTERAGRVNEALAALAQKHGLGFGLGSQRAMLEDPARADSFKVRAFAPDALVLGNLGLRQAGQAGAKRVLALVDAVGADGLCVHLNAAQELTQPEGERDFRGGYRVIADLVDAFGPRLVVKETGCGISPEVGRRLSELGVRCLDVSGAGGTSWVRVEGLRAEGVAAEVAQTFAGWGIPTAAAIATVRRVVGPEVTLIASGGIRDGLEAAKALALGADLVGMALPLFRAFEQGGAQAAEKVIETVLAGLRHALLLTGSGTPARLREKRKILTGELRDWVAAL